jgi:hypothetical protein
MVKLALWVILVSFVWPFLAKPASAVDQVKPAFHEEMGQAWDVIGRELQGFFDLWQEHFGSTGQEKGRRFMIIRNREKLVSTEQVRVLSD